MTGIDCTLYGLLGFGLGYFLFGRTIEKNACKKAYSEGKDSLKENYDEIYQ